MSTTPTPTATPMDSDDTSSSTSLSPPFSPDGDHRRRAKRPSGRKKFRETRHPVYRGVRARAGGTRWVCEVREPLAQARIWLGTYPTPEMAARAHDVAAIALLRSGAGLNFPDSPAALPRASTASPADIRRAAAQAAELYRPRAHRLVTPPPPPLALPLPEATAPDADGFVDEDDIFDMPRLIDDMARGMLLTPPAMDWNDDEDHCHMDMDCNLWSLDG